MSPPVEVYLDALAANDWDALGRVVASNIERIGPYGDIYNGRDEYVTFLRDTFATLRAYELTISRVLDAGSTMVVELRESVDDGDDRLHTREAVVFDVLDGVITRIAVYLQTSVREPRPRSV